MRIRTAAGGLVAGLVSATAFVGAAVNVMADGDAGRRIPIGAAVQGTPAGIPEDHYVVAAPRTPAARGAAKASTVAEGREVASSAPARTAALAAPVSPLPAGSTPAAAVSPLAAPAVAAGVAARLTELLSATGNQVTGGPGAQAPATGAAAETNLLRVRSGEPASKSALPGRDEKERYRSAPSTTTGRGCHVTRGAR